MVEAFLFVFLVLSIWLAINERAEFGRVSKATLATLAVMTVSAILCLYVGYISNVRHSMFAEYSAKRRAWAQTHPFHSYPYPFSSGISLNVPVGLLTLILAAVLLFMHGYRCDRLRKVPLSAVLQVVFALLVLFITNFVYNNT